MKQTLKAAVDPIGVGLAAPQVGYSIRVFLLRPTEKSTIKVLVNPEIKNQETTDTISYPSTLETNEKKSSSKEKKVKLEGCLSLLNVWGDVERKQAVTVSYLDEKGIFYTKEFKGFTSTIIQHEIDHLNGILFPKRVLEQKRKLYKSSKNEKGEDMFEEIEV